MSDYQDVTKCYNTIPAFISPLEAHECLEDPHPSLKYTLPL